MRVLVLREVQPDRSVEVGLLAIAPGRLVPARRHWQLSGGVPAVVTQRGDARDAVQFTAPAAPDSTPPGFRARS